MDEQKTGEEQRVIDLKRKREELSQKSPRERVIDSYLEIIRQASEDLAKIAKGEL